mmetsp:Transcript_15152/g.31717  ORF Transcript_15152/g.31717 Transcript_15152/m.31717 type:complete len:255 (-) Transcript_15152:682-1446(-)
MVGVVRGAQAGKGHACDKAAPQVRPQEMRDGAVEAEKRDLHHEEQLILRQLESPEAACGPPLLWGLRQDHPVDQGGHDLHRSRHGSEHEGDADDRRKHHGEEVEFAAPQAEEDVEEHQGKDIVHKCGCDDSLPEVFLQDASLSQEPQRDANACGGQGSACRNSVGEEGAAEEHKHDSAGDKRQDGPEHRNGAGRRTHDPRLFEVEVHAALEDHHGHTCVANQCEDVRCELAVVRDVCLAALHEALLKGVVAASS